MGNAPTARAGIDIKGNSAGENPTHITVRHCVAYENNTTDFPGVDGIMISKAVGAALTSGCIIENCVSRDNRGHGIKARIGASNTTIRNCVAYNNGAGVAAHGIGTAGTRVSVPSFTLVSGTIYSATLTPANYGETAAITSIDAVWTSNTTYGSLVSAGTSGTPAAGEYSVPANNTLYINIGTNPSGTTVEASKNPPINTLIQDCTFENCSRGVGVGATYPGGYPATGTMIINNYFEGTEQYSVWTDKATVIIGGNMHNGKPGSIDYYNFGGGKYVEQK